MYSIIIVADIMEMFRKQTIFTVIHIMELQRTKFLQLSIPQGWFQNMEFSLLLIQRTTLKAINIQQFNFNVVLQK